MKLFCNFLSIKLKKNLFIPPFECFFYTYIRWSRPIVYQILCFLLVGQKFQKTLILYKKLVRFVDLIYRVYFLLSSPFTTPFLDIYLLISSRKNLTLMMTTPLWKFILEMENPVFSNSLCRDFTWKIWEKFLNKPSFISIWWC